MGTCCSKSNQDSGRPLVYHHGYKLHEGGLEAGGIINTAGGITDPRYAPDPKGGIATVKRQGVDIIRTPTTSFMPNSGRGKIVVAVYNYQSREAADVSFLKGDRMEIIDDSEPDWWRVRHLRTGDEGLIPWNFVAPEKSVESEDWFFGKISRKEAEKLLLAEENPRGTFLVRDSEHNPLGFSLSVKDWEETRGYHAKHYKIKPLDKGAGYFIASSQTFPGLHLLINAYSKNALGLCHVLSRPCPKPKPQIWDLSPELRDSWEIDRSEIVLLKKLGQGNFGEVWYGKWRNNIEVAVKTLRQGTMSTQAFLQEAAIMKKFRHDRLVALYAVCSKEEPVYIVQEFMNKGSLLEFLRNGEGRLLQFGDLIYIAAQVSSGMAYLELKQLIHRDLAARNVLIGDNNVAKICDFGLARVIEDDEYCPRQGSRFPVKWTAPEAIVYGRFSIKSDVWSYGILLMELFTYGQVPYPGMHGRDVIEQVERGYRMTKPASHYIPDAIYRLMLQCWDANSDKRPTFEFLKHYFEDFNITSEMPYKELNEDE
uniref:Tyrosine-protein kinase n=2 Tax=Cacopsylla melanoneura TaxID=428564 RepID=A0A8D9F015_9HEMI